jgi:hypothetical protein
MLVPFRTKLFLVGLVPFLCVSAGAAVSVASQGRPASFSPLAKEYRGSSERRVMLAIRNDREWLKLNAELSSGRRAKVPMLPNDYFERKMIIAVFQGRQPSSGYDIRITRLVETDDQLKVYVEDIKVKGCLAQDVITTPGDMVETARTTKRVTFEVTEKFPDCSDLKHN